MEKVLLLTIRSGPYFVSSEPVERIKIKDSSNVELFMSETGSKYKFTNLEYTMLILGEEVEKEKNTFYLEVY